MEDGNDYSSYQFQVFLEPLFVSEFLVLICLNILAEILGAGEFYNIKINSLFYRFI